MNKRQKKKQFKKVLKKCKKGFEFLAEGYLEDIEIQIVIPNKKNPSRISRYKA